MIRCETCDAVSYPGTLFCKEGGRYLLDVSNQAQLEHREQGKHVHYLISGSRRQGKLNSTAQIWIGRADPDEGYWPQLDLTDDGGVELGVSRRHALIQGGDQGLVLIDQHSTNGTWIDEERLVSGRPYPLPQSTKVRFGHLLVHIFQE